MLEIYDEWEVLREKVINVRVGQEMCSMITVKDICHDTQLSLKNIGTKFYVLCSERN